MAAAPANPGILVQLGDMGLKTVTGAVIDRFAAESDPPLGVEIELAALVRQYQRRFGIEATIPLLAKLDAVALSVPVVKVTFQGFNGLAVRQVYTPLAASFRDAARKLTSERMVPEGCNTS